MESLSNPHSRPEHTVPASPALHGIAKGLGAGLSAVFLTVIAAISGLPGAALVFFPELAALAYDVMIRPRGAWAAALPHLGVVPALTAVVVNLFLAPERPPN